MIEHHDQMTINELMNVLLQFTMSWYPDMLKDNLFLFSLYKLQVIVFISQTLDMILQNQNC
jgi:hypothetical protein